MLSVKHLHKPYILDTVQNFNKSISVRISKKLGDIIKMSCYMTNQEV